VSRLPLIRNDGLRKANDLRSSKRGARRKAVGVLHKGWWKVGVQLWVVIVEAGDTEEEAKRGNEVRLMSSVGLQAILKPRGTIRGDLNSTHPGDHGFCKSFFFHNSDMRGAYVFLTLVIVPHLQSTRNRVSAHEFIPLSREQLLHVLWASLTISSILPV
jgi:hypothetical protein